MKPELYCHISMYPDHRTPSYWYIDLDIVPSKFGGIHSWFEILYFRNHAQSIFTNDNIKKSFRSVNFTNCIVILL